MNPIVTKYGASPLPQVNLVPKNINDKRTMRLVKTIAGIAALAAVVLVALVFFGAYAAKTVSQNALRDALNDEDQAVAARDAKVDVYYDYVTQETQEFTLFQIGWPEIDNSRLLTSILAQDTDEVSFESVHIYGPNATVRGGPEVDPIFGGGVGSFDFVAHARTYEDALALMDRLEEVPGIAKVQLQSQDYLGDVNNLSWEVTGRGVLTSLLLTHRLEPEDGIVDPQVVDALLGGETGLAADASSPSPTPTPTPTPTATTESEG